MVSEGEQIIAAREPNRLLRKTLIAVSPPPPLRPAEAGAECDFGLAVLVVVELWLFETLLLSVQMHR